VPISGRAASWGRIPILAAALSLPGWAVLAALALSELLAAGWAALGGAAILALTALIVARPVLAFASLRSTVAALANEAPARLRSASQIRLAIERSARDWRGHSQQTEAGLAAAETVIAALPDPLLLLDERRRIVRANAAATALVGQAAALPRDLASALRNPALLAAADAVIGGAAARVIEFALPVPADRQLRARLARIDRPAPDGAVAVLTLHDVTELKRAEQMRADFIANASHELRTPLATLTGFIETLRGPARDDAEAGERFLAIMQAQAARMTRLVEDLLSLSRIELNEHVPPQDRVAVPGVLQQLADALELRAAERGMSIVLALPPSLPDVQGDRDELSQLFQNLLDNAIKYGRAGTEITVAAETVERPAMGDGAGSSALVSVAVKDRGEGIRREHLPRLTERFYRIDTARSREMGGTGLGLAIVKHIVARHRGFLEIDSALGEGSVFTVRLRRHPEAADVIKLQ
jgi:two-component system phosphate regulon sensor histidine kinase PhoR